MVKLSRSGANRRREKASWTEQVTLEPAPAPPASGIIVGVVTTEEPNECFLMKSYLRAAALRSVTRMETAAGLTDKWVRQVFKGD